MRFKNLAHFISYVKTGEIKNVVTELPNGGFAVPEKFLGNFMATGLDEAIVRPRALNLDPVDEPFAASNSPDSSPDYTFSIPILQHYPENGLVDNIKVYWTAEGQAMTEETGDFVMVNLNPHEVSAFITLLDKHLRNSKPANKYLSMVLKSACAQAEDRAFLVGNGIGKPLGVLNSPARLQVNRTTAGQINPIDVYNMLKKMMPSSLPYATWVANSSAILQLLTFQDPNGGNTNLFKLGEQEGKGITLAGLPLKFTGVTPSVGSRGDLMLCDFRYYSIKNGFGPAVSISGHNVNLFYSNMSELKVVWNVDGQPWVRDPLVFEETGEEVSPFVVLK